MGFVVVVDEGVELELGFDDDVFASSLNGLGLILVVVEDGLDVDDAVYFKTETPFKPENRTIY